MSFWAAEKAPKPLPSPVENDHEGAEVGKENVTEGPDQLVPARSKLLTI